jgi:hypothetical protein
MTRAARRDVASICLCTRCVTAKTGDVGIQSRWNRQPNATAISSMTSSAIDRACVFRVVEPDVETSQGRKCFDLSALRVCMTDSANLTCWICELLRVTDRARCVCSFAGQGRLRGVVFSSMAEQTRKPRMIAIIVFELRVITDGLNFK